jgi:methyltransferase (TIGR00027 family)
MCCERHHAALACVVQESRTTPPCTRAWASTGYWHKERRVPIQHISDTARWVAVYRAMETDRPDALFRDPFARRLAGPEGQAIVDELPRGRSMAWPMIVRTAVFDEIILDRIARHGVDLVLNLAAGLDARAWRLPLPPALRWVDADLPAILDYKTDALSAERPVCRYEAVAADLRVPEAREALFARLDAEASQILVITEGLLIYLTPDQVGALARDLHASPHFRWWVTDLGSPRLLRIIRRYWGKAVAKGAAPFQFAPQEGTAFFRPFGWRELEFRSGINEAHRLHREMRTMWIWRLVARLSPARQREEFRRMSGYVLLERNDS